MKRRWIIRILFMLPIVLNAVGWMWSGFYTLECGYFHPSRGVGIGVGYGSVLAIVGPNGPMPTGWVWRIRWHGPEFSLGRTSIRNLLGFIFLPEGTTRGSYLVGVPFWSLLIVFSMMLLIVWRKTRSRKTGGAFPVEVAEKDGGRA